MSPNPVVYGGSSTGGYSSNADYCDVYQNGSLSWAHGDPSFSSTVGPFTTSQSWTFKCYNSGGMSQASNSLTVCASGQTVSGGNCVTPLSAPTVSVIPMNPSSIPAGGYSTGGYSSNADYCDVYQNGSLAWAHGDPSFNGTVGPFSTSQSWVYKCYNSSGMNQVSNSLTVTAVTAPTSAWISANPVTVTPNQTFVNTWGGNNTPTYYNASIGTLVYTNLDVATYGTSSGNLTAATIAGGPLNPGSYSLKVQACNTAGCSGWFSGTTLVVQSAIPIVSWSPATIEIPYNGTIAAGAAGFTSSGASYCKVWDAFSGGGGGPVLAYRNPDTYIWPTSWTNTAALGPFTDAFSRKLVCYTAANEASAAAYEFVNMPAVSWWAEGNITPSATIATINIPYGGTVAAGSVGFRSTDASYCKVWDENGDPVLGWASPPSYIWQGGNWTLDTDITNITASFSRKIICYDSSDNASAPAYLYENVVAADAVTATLSVSPTSVAPNDRPTLTWSSTNATSCTAPSGNWSNSGTLSGNGLSNPLTADTTFTFQCTGPSGTSPLQSVTVTVSAVPPTCSNGANNPETCNQCANGYAYISSTCTTCGNGGCTGLGGGAGNALGSLVCINGANNPQSCDTFPPPAGTLPTITFSANPATINSGQSSVLTWSSANATSCYPAGGEGIGFSTGGVTVNPSGGVLVSPSATANYQISCTGPGGSANSNIATVSVLSPAVSINANPTRVQSGGNSSISWSASGVVSCVVTGPSGTLANGAANASDNFTTGSPQSVPISSRSTFTITCQTADSSVTSSVVVNVVPLFTEF